MKRSGGAVITARSETTSQLLCGIQHIQVGERLNLGIDPSQEGDRVSHSSPAAHLSVISRPALWAGSQQRAHLGGIAWLHRSQQPVPPLGHIPVRTGDIVHRQAVEQGRQLFSRQVFEQPRVASALVSPRAAAAVAAGEGRILSVVEAINHPAISAGWRPVKQHAARRGRPDAAQFRTRCSSASPR
jgi:hypothetical protein